LTNGDIITVLINPYTDGTVFRADPSGGGGYAPQIEVRRLD